MILAQSYPSSLHFYPPAVLCFFATLIYIIQINSAPKNANPPPNNPKTSKTTSIFQSPPCLIHSRVGRSFPKELNVRRFFIYWLRFQGDLLIQAMKAIKLALLLLLVVSALAHKDSDKSTDQAKLTRHRLPKSGERHPDTIYKFVDHGLREKYWYYLTKANLIYVAAVNRTDTFQFLAVYRNIVGTFLAITTWKNQSSTFDVNTLVRLGNGYAKNSGANYKPVKLSLRHFRYSLGAGEFLIDVSDCGDVKLNGKELSDNLNDNLKKENHYESYEELVAKCKEFSEFTEKKFWYYLKGAQVVYSSAGTVNDKNYCLVTYVNNAGTFFVIGNQQKTSKLCEVNTFVRLGNGYDDDSEANYKPVNFQKITLPLAEYED